MAAVDYSVLDSPQASGTSFYPQRHWTETPEGAVDCGITVDDGVQLSARFFPVGQENPTVLFFYGNGETAAGYDNIAPLYNRIGVNFFVVDYRGYGASGGTPSFSVMLADAVTVLDSLRDMLTASDFTGPLYVMGRSMGRHSAFELAVEAADRIDGVIIESGRPNLARFTMGLDAEAAQAMEDAYHAKAYSISIPTLVIHGEQDELAPVQDAVAMHDNMQTEDKHLLVIAGAGHNDLMFVGLRQYFEAIRRFVVQYGGAGGGDGSSAEN